MQTTTAQQSGEPLPLLEGQRRRGIYRAPDEVLKPRGRVVPACGLDGRGVSPSGCHSESRASACNLWTDVCRRHDEPPRFGVPIASSSVNHRGAHLYFKSRLHHGSYRSKYDTRPVASARSIKGRKRSHGTVKCVMRVKVSSPEMLGWSRLPTHRSQAGVTLCSVQSLGRRSMVSSKRRHLRHRIFTRITRAPSTRCAHSRDRSRADQSQA